MCGRFTLRTPPQEVANFFGLDEVPELTPRYNIAPTQDVAAVRFDPASGRRQLSFLHWGLIPAWAAEPKTSYSTINARAETVATKPAYRQAFKKRRCLIVADGFYEWHKVGSKKQPYRIHMKDDGPFAFAGLWERWQRGEGPALESCTIIVTSANGVLAPLHDRMPVILDPHDFDEWLDPIFDDVQALEQLLLPFADAPMEAYPVSTRVNNPRSDVPECLAPMTQAE
jgi:putative SOS response-associated peptidase YedK